MYLLTGHRDRRKPHGSPRPHHAAYVVVPMAEADEILREKIKAGVTIGELMRIDDVFKSTSAYHPRRKMKND
jgi:hypothetical protein